MSRVWRVMALVAAGWCLNVTAQAQYGSGSYPSPLGATRMPEPIPCGPTDAAPPAPQPNLIPGPISPQAAPMGPPDCLSLPADHTGAFQCENYVDGSGMYVHIGPMALQRNKLGAGDVAVFDSASVGQQLQRDLGLTVTPALPSTPLLPAPAGIASALNFNSVTPALSLGIRGTVGYLWESQSIEFTSFYIFQNDVTKTALSPSPGSLDSLFYNPPLEFLGTNMFRDATMVSLTQGSSLFSSELNYRRWNAGVGGLELIAGLRYVRQNDSLGIQSQADTLANELTGGTNATNPSILPTVGRDVALYQVLCHNNIVAPQLGAEYGVPITSWFSISGMGKVGLGANYLTTDVSLSRGDGMVGFDTQRNAWNFAGIYEMGAFTDFNILQKLHLRLGYTATWLTGVAVSNDQVDFNLMGAQARQAFGSQGVIQAIESKDPGNQLRNVQQSIPHGRVNNNGSLLYFGPQIEMQFFF